MKKITFLFAVLGMGIFAQAQQFQAVSNAPFNPTPVNNPQAIIWDQPTGNTSGIISSYSNTDSQGVWAADDFELTESTRIDKITVYGFQNNGDLESLVNGVDVFIYANTPGNTPDGNPTIPGSGVVEFTELSALPIPGYPVVITTVDGFEFEIDMFIANGEADLILPAGNYWLAFAPRLNITPVTDGPSRWNWFDAALPANGVNEAHLIDPDDLFGAGATNWTSFTNLGLDFGSVAFLIEGEAAALGVNDNISELASVYPNPTKDVLNVEIPSTVTVNSSSLYNLLGQDTGMKLVNGTMNVSDLARGIYILNVETSAGTLTQKVVKN